MPDGKEPRTDTPGTVAADGTRPPPTRRPGWFPFTVTLVYAALGSVWILLSDRVALELASDLETFRLVQTYKGWLYVGATALLLFAALGAAEHHIRRERHAREETLHRLDLALHAAQGGIWERGLDDGRLFISAQIKQLLGLSPDTELSLEDWRARIHPDDRNYARVRMRDFLRYPNQEISLCYRVGREDGEYCWFQIVGRCVAPDGGKRGHSRRLLGVMIDVTALRHAEADIERLIHYDALTGLPNRSMFHSELQHALAENHSQGLLVARCDLDAFGEVNTEFGAEEGDHVLATVAARLRAFAGVGGFCGRIGGDEFALALPFEASVPRAVGRLADGLKAVFDQPVTLETGPQIEAKANIGIAVFPEDGDSADALLANAAVAAGAARKEGRGTLRFYASGMNTAVRARKTLARDLRDALRHDRLEAYYQPIVSLPGRNIVGFEALVRWTHPEHGPVSPARFIPVAEEHGMIGDIGQFMLRQACREAKAWEEAFKRNFRIAVNLSALDLADAGLHARIGEILSETGLPPAMLELEVTESAVMSDIDFAIETLEQLRALGISIAIDDFGTGYSSLVALRRLPVSKLKIDRSFVDGYGTEAEDTAIVNSVIELAHTLDLTLTAEGVETEGQCAMLSEHGCEHAQGYLFSPPVPPTRAWHLFAEGRAPGQRGVSLEARRQQRSARR